MNLYTQLHYCVSMMVRLLIVFWTLFSLPTHALNSERSSLSKRLDEADLVVIAKVISDGRTVGDKEFDSFAMLKLSDSSGDEQLGSTIKLYFGTPMIDDTVLCCVVGQEYVLFLKRRKDGYEPAAGLHSLYAVLPDVSDLLDEVRLTISREHAETWLYLHHLSRMSRRASPTAAR
jgi:hypothetical protein